MKPIDRRRTHLAIPTLFRSRNSLPACGAQVFAHHTVVGFERVFPNLVVHDLREVTCHVCLRIAHAHVIWDLGMVSAQEVQA